MIVRVALTVPVKVLVSNSSKTTDSSVSSNDINPSISINNSNL